MRPTLLDPFAVFKSLDGFDLYAGDGHFIAAASHDKAAPRKKPEKLGNAKAPGRTSALKRQDIVTLGTPPN